VALVLIWRTKEEEGCMWRAIEAEEKGNRGETVKWR
jgi:hypothetical protein